jgi:phage terminase small subunit
VATNRVLEELARIAFSDIGDVFDARGALIPFADLPPGIRSAIAEYRVRRGRNGTYTVRVRVHSKLAALAALGRHLGIFDRRSDRAALGR